MQNWIYINTHDDDARFVLGEKGTRCLTCIGINPSTARPNDLDNTLRQVRNRALLFGYDSWTMINVYPQRATNPNDLDSAPNADYHQKNLVEIEKLLANNDVDLWAAWGTIITKRPYLKSCLSDIINIANKYNVNWFTIGKKSIAGHPHHPLYLKKELPLDPFKTDDYLALISQ
jgi:hypothetical protein